jgi:arylsulfatase A-like enzyme
MRSLVKYQLFIRLALAMALAVTMVPPCTSAAAQGQKKRNFLFILADDMRRDAIAGLGNGHISTPNIDKLVKRGTTFTRAYIQGAMGGAVCVPSRAMIHTGRSFLKAPLDMKGQLTLGELLRRAGYLSCGIGKWHNGPESWLHSFEIGNAILFDGMADHFNVAFLSTAGAASFQKLNARGKHSSEVIAGAAVNFLKNQAGKGKNAGKPFFLYVAFTAPHDPRDAPVKYREMYYKNKPPLPKNFLPQHPFDNGDLVQRDENLAPWPRTKEVIEDQLAEYYALITHMDEQIGLILQALEDSGELENTIIIFASDNGLALGSHGLVGKQNVYEDSVGVPLMFVGPGVPKDQKRDTPVYLLDIYPTLCELNGMPIPKNLDGVSLTKVMTGEQTKVRESMYFNYKHQQRSAMKDDWKLICYPQINYEQLFDLKTDPDEMTNLADKAENTKRIAELKTLIQSWEKGLGLPVMPLTSANPKAKEIDLTGHARQADKWQPEWIRKKYFDK